MNTKPTVYLVCGVSGSGKTWVCKQLQHKFTYVPHDEHFKDHDSVAVGAAKAHDKPVITECPFGERLLRAKLEKAGVKVIPYFVVEHPDIVARRFLLREKKPIQKAAITRAVTIIERAKEWHAPMGTSEQILRALREV